MEKRVITQPLLPFLLIVLTFFSCREKVNWDFPEFEPVPTINSFFVAGEPIKIHVSLAGKFDSIPLGVVDDANVAVYADETFIEYITDNQQGVYTTSFNAQPGVEYHCEVAIPGFQMVTAVNKIPQQNSILNIEHINFAGVDEEGVSYPAVKIEFSNNPNENLYYEVVIHLQKFDWDTRPELISITDPVLLNEGLPISLFSNEIINGDSYCMTINYTTGSASYSSETGWHSELYPLTVELRSVSYDYYMYVKQLYLYETGRYPSIIGGVVTPFPLYSNVNGGYGIFAGYSSVQTDTIYP